MSNPEPTLKRAARWHRPAILAIIAVFVLVGLAILFLAPARTEDEDIARQTDAAAPAPTAEGTEATAVEPAPPPEPQTAQPEATTDPSAQMAKPGTAAD